MPPPSGGGRKGFFGLKLTALLLVFAALAASPACFTKAAQAPPTPQAGEKLHQDTVRRFAILSPEPWQQVVVDEPSTVLALQAPDGTPLLLVYLARGPGDATLEARFEEALQFLSSKLNDLKVTQRKAAALRDGAPSLQVWFDYLALGEPRQGRLLVVARGNESFRVVALGTPEDFQRLEQAVGLAFNSFTLLAPASGDVSRKDSLVLAEQEPITLDPALSQESRSHQYIVQLFSGLVRLDENLRIAPDLAERWDVLDGGTRYVFHLRKDARFHSGRPVTAQDVAYSLERAADPATGSDTAATYLGDIIGVGDKLKGAAQNIAGLRVIDRHTLEVRLDGPKAYFLAKMTYSAAMVVDRENVSEGPEWWRRPNGTGPFKLLVWEKGQRLVLERNDDFYRGAPRLKYAVFRVLAGVPVRLYEQGEVDAAYVDHGSLERVQDPQSPLNRELSVYPEMNIYYTGFNAAKPPFNDPLVRRAFAMALDVDRLVGPVRQGAVQRAAGFLPPGMPGYLPDTQPIPFDPAQARQLLGRSSYGGPQGLPPIVYTTSGQGDIGPTLAAMVEMWRANLGVDVSVRQIPSDVYFYRLREEMDNLFEYGWVADYPDPENVLDVLFHTGASNNAGAYSNPQVDALLEAARTEQDVDRRLATYRQAQGLLLDDAAAIPLWHTSTYILTKPYVKGFAFTPQGLPTLERVYLQR